MAIPVIPLVTSVPFATMVSAPLSAAAPLGASGGAAFKNMFADAVQKVDAFQKNAGASVDRFLTGEGEEIHSVALAAQRAELSFELFMQVRNKMVSAYQEVMRMQV